jgi:hypothetical protein
MGTSNTPVIVAVVVAIISTIPGIVQAIYTALAYHRSKGRPGTPQTRSLIRNRSIWIMGIFPVVAWLAVAYDIYDRHQMPTACVVCLKTYGYGGGAIYATVDPSEIQRFADDFKLYLIARTAWPNIDEMTDVVIAKSSSYTITSQEMDMAIAKPKLNIALGQMNHIGYYLVVLPNDISIDQVLRLADVKKLGGRILAGKGTETVIRPDP